METPVFLHLRKLLSAAAKLRLRGNAGVPTARLLRGGVEVELTAPGAVVKMLALSLPTESLG